MPVKGLNNWFPFDRVDDEHRISGNSDAHLKKMLPVGCHFRFIVVPASDIPSISTNHLCDRNFCRISEPNCYMIYVVGNVPVPHFLFSRWRRDHGDALG
jgi:hypothetical protein